MFWTPLDDAQLRELRLRGFDSLSYRELKRVKRSLVSFINKDSVYPCYQELGESSKWIQLTEAVNVSKLIRSRREDFRSTVGVI